jgi:UDP-GlcNAc:undecaprenyl-phosphate GlcNAc-1-phosphate transferase
MDAVPRIGGAAILVAFLIGVAILAIGDEISSRQAFGFVGAVTLISVLGLIDDMRGLSPMTKLAGQIIGTSILLITGTSVEIISLEPFSTLLTFLWMIGITNALNLLDNMDGLAGGVSFVGLVFLAIHSGLADLTEISGLAIVLAAAVLGFLPFNLRARKKAAIFMGDGGSQMLGFAVAWLALASSWQQASGFVAALAVPLLVLAIPILDTALVSVMRTIEGRPISQGGRDHTSHRLVLKGISEKRAVLLLIGASAALGASALAFVQFNRLLLALIGLGMAVAVLLHFAMFLVQARKSEKREEVPEVADQRGWMSIETYRLHKRRFAEAFLDLILVISAYYLAYVLRYDQLPDAANTDLFAKSLPILVGLRFVAFSAFGLYRGLWRYAGTRDVARCIAAVVTSEIATIAALTFAWRFEGFSRSLFVTDALLCLVLIAGSRLAERGLGEWLHTMRDRRGTARALIVGAGDAGNALVRELRRRGDHVVIGFVDDDPRKRGSRAQGAEVLGDHRAIHEIIDDVRPEVVYVTIPNAPKDRLEIIAAACDAAGIRYRSVRGYDEETFAVPMATHLMTP